MKLSMALNSENVLDRVYVCGRGAVGLTFGDFFATRLPQGNFAFLVDPERKERYASKPVTVNGKPGDYLYLSGQDQAPAADLVFFACKSYSLPEAMEEARPFIDAHTILMSGINGISSEEQLEQAFPDNIVLHAIAQGMDSRYDPFSQELQYSTPGEFVFGAVDESRQEAASQVEALLSRCEVPFIHSDDILLDQYRKLMLNCGINQVCAAYDATYGQVSQDPALNQIFRQAMEETRQVLAALGKDPGKESLENWVKRIAGLDPDSMPSMAQDMVHHRPVELELFSGTIIPKVKALGIPVPTLEDLACRIEQKVQSWQ